LLRDDALRDGFAGIFEAALAVVLVVLILGMLVAGAFLAILGLEAFLAAGLLTVLVTVLVTFADM